MKTILFVILVSFVAVHAEAFSISLSVSNQARSCPAGSAGALEVEAKKDKYKSDELLLSVTVQDAGGPVNFNYYHTTEGFQLPPAMFGKTAMSIASNTKSKTVKFRFPTLRADRFYAQALVVVSATDALGNVAQDSKKIFVSRDVIVQKSQDLSLNCTQVFTPEIMSGLYDNQNDTDMTITTSDGVTKLLETTKSKSLGWSILPTILTGSSGFSLFGLNGNRLSGLAQQVNESSFTAITHNINPGDVAFRYIQRTRVKEAYDLLLADGCGGVRKAQDGMLYLDREFTVNNVYKVASPYDPEALDQALKTRNFGRPVINTCSAVDQAVIPYITE